MVQTRTLFIVHFLLSIWTSTQGPADGQHAYAAGVALHFFSNCLVRPCMHTRMIIGRSIDPYYFAWFRATYRCVWLSHRGQFDLVFLCSWHADQGITRLIAENILPAYICTSLIRTVLIMYCPIMHLRIHACGCKSVDNLLPIRAPAMVK